MKSGYEKYEKIFKKQMYHLKKENKLRKRLLNNGFTIEERKSKSILRKTLYQYTIEK